MSSFCPSTGRAARACRFARAGLALLALALCAALLPRAYAFSDGQVASLVLGQSDFTSSAMATSASGMSFPVGVAIAPVSNTVFVVDAFNSRVLRFASVAALLNGAAANGVLGQPDFTSSASAASASGMSTPYGVAVDSAGRLWVADSSNNRVLRFDGAATKPNGAPADGVLGQLNFTNSAGATTPSRMSYPDGVSIDSAGRLWVADTNNNRVLRFDGAAAKANGTPADGVLGQATFTSSSSATSASRMNYPESVAVDPVSGTMFVGDAGNNRVLRFDSAATKTNGAAANGVLGQSNFTNGAVPLGPTADKLDTPRGVTLDSAGRLWVADFNNNRVLRFDGAATKPNGAAADGVLGQPDFTSNAAALTASGMNFPFGLAVDSADNLWVADSGYNRVLRFDAKTSQTITFGTLANKIIGDAPFSVSATTSSGLAVTFTSSTPTVCTVSGSTVTLVAAGTCTINASQAGDTTYSAAPQVPQAFTVSPAGSGTTSQTITFGALANKTAGDAPFSLSATASSGLAVTFTSTAPAVCTVSGSTVTLVATGTCTITASQAGDTTYSAAPQVPQSFTISPAGSTASQIIIFGALANKVVGNAPFSVDATTTSGLAVTFSSSTPTVCTVTGSTVTLVAAGSCTIAANQGGNASFGAAAPVTQSFSVAAALGPASQTITFAALPNKTLGDAPFTVSVRATSGLAVTFSSSTPTVCTVTGNTVTLAAVGTCTIAATQGGNTNFSAAAPVAQSFSVAAKVRPLTRVYLPLMAR